MDYLKEFTAKIQSLDRSRSPYEVFKDVHIHLHSHFIEVKK